VVARGCTLVPPEERTCRRAGVRRERFERPEDWSKRDIGASAHDQVSACPDVFQRPRRDSDCSQSARSEAASSPPRRDRNAQRPSWSSHPEGDRSFCQPVHTMRRLRSPVTRREILTDRPERLSVCRLNQASPIRGCQGQDRARSTRGTQNEGSFPVSQPAPGRHCGARPRDPPIVHRIRGCETIRSFNHDQVVEAAGMLALVRTTQELPPRPVDAPAMMTCGFEASSGRSARADDATVPGVGSSFVSISNDARPERVRKESLLNSDARAEQEAGMPGRPSTAVRAAAARASVGRGRDGEEGGTPRGRWKKGQADGGVAPSRAGGREPLDRRGVRCPHPPKPSSGSADPFICSQRRWPFKVGVSCADEAGQRSRTGECGTLRGACARGGDSARGSGG